MYRCICPCADMNICIYKRSIAEKKSSKKTQSPKKLNTDKQTNAQKQINKHTHFHKDTFTHTLLPPATDSHVPLFNTMPTGLELFIAAVTHNDDPSGAQDILLKMLTF